MNTKNIFETNEQRSKLMKKIKGKNTKSEILVRKELWKRGFRYRINDKRIKGKPDICFFRKKLAIFIDGEFWHGYKWHEKRNRIKSNKEYWIYKIERNIIRDDTINKELKLKGWTVLRFWDKQVQLNLNEIISQIIEILDEKTKNSCD